MASDVANSENTSTGLLDLATELIQGILEYLDDSTDILHLALLSKRLHVIALSSCICRSNLKFSNLGSIFLSLPPMQTLKALRMALFVKNLTYLYVLLCDNPMIPSLKGLERLIRRLSFVESFQIDFMYQGHMTDRSREMDGLRCLLGALSGRGCTNLAIRDLHVRSAVKMGSDLDMGDLTNEMLNSRLAQDICPITTLRSLTIHNSNLSPSMVSWVINTCNMSPINDLRVNITIVSDDELPQGMFLCSLTLPYLQRFKLRLDDVSYNDITIFLARHPHIQDLHLETNATIPSNASAHPVNEMADLRSLRAPPLFAIHLLTLPCPFPKLTHVAIDAVFLRVSFDHDNVTIAKRFRHMEASFTAIALCSGVNTLSVDLPPYSQAADWLEVGSEPSGGQRSNVERRLTNIQTLTIESCDPFDREIGPLLLRWIALFPSLRRVEFGSWACRTLTQEQPESDFVEAIGEACLTLEKVRIGAKSYPIH